MKDVEKEVKLKGETVATIMIPTFETVEELAEIEPAKLLSLVNRQNAADITNAERAKHREKTAGKGKRHIAAINCLASTMFDDGESGIQKLQAISILDISEEEKASKTKELLASPEVQKVVDAALAS